jgi:hypothetical protein
MHPKERRAKKMRSAERAGSSEKIKALTMPIHSKPSLTINGAFSFILSPQINIRPKEKG